MVAPALAALGMFLLGQGSSAVSTAALRSMRKSDAEEQRKLFQSSIARAQGQFPGMPPGLEGNGFDPLANPDSMQRFGLNLMNDPATAQMGQSVLDTAVRDASSRAGDSVTMRGQDVTMRGQDLQAQNQLAQLQQDVANNARTQANEREGRLQTVRNDIQPLVAPIVTASGMMRSALNAPEGFAGDSVLVRSFARQLNPTGPLSDADVAAVANDPSIPQVIGNAIARWSKGDKLTPEERARIKQAAAGLYRGNRDAALTLAGPVLNTSDRLGFPRAEIFDESALVDDATLAPYIDYVPPQAPGAPAAGGGGAIPAGWNEKQEEEYQRYLKWAQSQEGG